MKKNYFLLISVFIMGCNSSQDTTNVWYDDVYFEHPAMKQCLIGWAEEYGWTNVDEVTELSCSRNGIDSIAGIEQFDNLKKLSLSYTALKEINLSGNPKLEDVHISKNPYLKSVDVSQNLELTMLYVIYNAVEEVNLSNLPKLNMVNLSGNLISQLKLDGTDAEFLFVEDNLIKDIDLSNTRSIRDLRLQGNPLNSIDLSNLHDLKTLFVNDTGIASLDISFNRELGLVVAFNNNIEHIRFDDNPNLKVANVENNPLNEETLDYLSTIDWIETLQY